MANAQSQNGGSSHGTQSKLGLGMLGHMPNGNGAGGHGDQTAIDDLIATMKSNLNVSIFWFCGVGKQR